MNQTSDSTKTERGTSVLRQKNREWIASIILQNTPVTRGRISEITGLTGAAVSRITRELIDIGLVAEGDAIKSPKRVGRREFELKVNPQGAYFLGISITANRRNVCLADATGAVLETIDCGDIDLSDPNAFLEQLSIRTLELVEQSGIDTDRLYGAGVSMAMSSGIGRDAMDQLVDSDPLGWSGVPVKQKLQQHLNMQVIIEHRASALLRGELRSGEMGESVYLVNLALGFGCCGYFGGRFLLTGDPGFGTITHLAIPGREESCACGRKGCLEEVASGKAVIRKLFGAVSDPALHLKRAITLADEGDSAARDAFFEAGALLGEGLNSVSSLLEPELFLIAGEIGRQDDYFRGIQSTLITEFGADASITLARSKISSENAAISVAMHTLLTGFRSNFVN